MTVRELGERLGVVWEGAAEISGAAALESAGPGDLAFVGSRKAWGEAAVSLAGCLVVPPDFPGGGRALLRAENPRTTFARAVALLVPARRLGPVGIHPTAVVSLTAELGADVAIGPYVVIGERAKIGAGTQIGASAVIGDDATVGKECNIYPHVVVYSGVELGSRVTLHAGCVLGADGFGFALAGGRYEKFPQIGTVHLDDDVEVGVHTCVDRAALGVTSVGRGTKLDNLVHVGHNCRIGAHVVVAAQSGFAGGVTIDDYAVIGGQVGIGDKAHIESQAVLGSGCGVLTSKIVRRGQVVWGTPARPLRDYLQQLAHVARLPGLVKRLERIETHVFGSGRTERVRGQDQRRDEPDSGAAGGTLARGEGDAD